MGSAGKTWLISSHLIPAAVESSTRRTTVSSRRRRPWIVSLLLLFVVSAGMDGERRAWGAVAAAAAVEAFEEEETVTDDDMESSNPNSIMLDLEEQQQPNPSPRASSSEDEEEEEEKDVSSVQIHVAREDPYNNMIDDDDDDTNAAIAKEEESQGATETTASTAGNKRVWGGGGGGTATDAAAAAALEEASSSPSPSLEEEEEDADTVDMRTTTSSSSILRRTALRSQVTAAEDLSLSHRTAENSNNNKRPWGADLLQKEGDGGRIGVEAAAETESDSSSSNSESMAHLPFVATKHGLAAAAGTSSSSTQHQQRINPPEGFTFAARVYIGEDDKLAHFDTDDQQQCPVSLAYFDCGASGSTTAALPVQNAYFRHSLSAPTVWNDPDMHAALAVALQPLVMELDSGETLRFQAGDVILLEDTIQPGHRILGSDDKHHHHNSVSVLFLTLPKPHYHTGKNNLSLKQAVTHADTPCPDRDSIEDSVDGDFSSIVAVKRRRRHRQQVTTSWDARRIRMFAFGTVALSISTLAADFLAKTAPLWLAVGIGGTCFVAGTTYGLTLSGEYLFTVWDLRRERQKLAKHQETND